MEKFRELGIIEPILKAIEDEGFTEPTEIQQKSIPPILEGKDIIAGSKTGSGKTLAFGAQIITHCEKKREVQALVLTPTRELAEQVADALKTFSKYKKLKITTVYGGVSINPQIKNLETTDVVVGTPGRILDHLERRTINLSNVKVAVLDEADTMLDMGFIYDVNKIMSQCSRKRQTLLYSATITPEISHISRKFLKDPVKISAGAQVNPNKLKQVYYDARDNEKFSLLVHLIKQEKPGLIMIFCNSRENVDFVAKNLRHNGVEAIAIHGGYSQDKRSKVLKDFHGSEVAAMVCTDVAARGLDIQNVSHVYNYDIPKDPKQYIHRIGRTARAGKEGIAINVLSQRDHSNFGRLQHEYSLPIEKMQKPDGIQRVELIGKSNSRHRYGNRDAGHGRGGGQGGRQPQRSARQGSGSRGNFQRSDGSNADSESAKRSGHGRRPSPKARPKQRYNNRKSKR